MRFSEVRNVAISSMVKSIGGKLAVRFSEGPLLEILLYRYVHFCRLVMSVLMYVVSYSDPPLGGLMGGLGSRLCPDVSFVYSILNWGNENRTMDIFFANNKFLAGP